MRTDVSIPIVDGEALAADRGDARRFADAQVERACRESGFMVIAAPPGAATLSPERRAKLLSVFELDDAGKRRLYRRKFVPTNANRYRGLAPMAPGLGIFTENLDLGSDAVSPGGRGDRRDALCEPSAWPDEWRLPGWRAEVGRTFAAFEALGRLVVASIERVLDVAPGRLTRAFEGGNSTFTLARHPAPGEWDDATCHALDVEREANAAEVTDGAGRERPNRVMQLVLPHCDSGCVTFVSQDEGGGLQARAPNGAWVDVPSERGRLAVNFGHLLERWTHGAVRATEHRVLGTARRRTSIPFFYEPRVDARIEPICCDADFEPFLYGDHVWERMQQFPDYQGLGERFADPDRSDA